MHVLLKYVGVRVLFAVEFTLYEERAFAAASRGRLCVDALVKHAVFRLLVVREVHMQFYYLQ